MTGGWKLGLPFPVGRHESWQDAQRVAEFMADKWRAPSADDEQIAMMERMGEDGVDLTSGYMLVAYRAVVELAEATGEDPTVILGRFARESSAAGDDPL